MQSRNAACLFALLVLAGSAAFAQAPKRGADPGACDDPLKERNRYVVTPLEIEDAKTRLVWFRCPALRTGRSGYCDPSLVLPSETWSAAVQVPPWAEKRPTPWRLASAEELDTIAARGCGYLLNRELIEVMFDTVWTRNGVGGDKVLRYGMDRARIESPKRFAPNTDFAQAIYVRDMP